MGRPFCAATAEGLRKSIILRNWRLLGFLATHRTRHRPVRALAGALGALSRLEPVRGSTCARSIPQRLASSSYGRRSFAPPVQVSLSRSTANRSEPVSCPEVPRPVLRWGLFDGSATRRPLPGSAREAVLQRPSGGLPARRARWPSSLASVLGEEVRRPDTGSCRFRSPSALPALDDIAANPPAPSRSPMVRS